MKSGEILVELLPKTTNKSTFCEVVKGLLNEKTLISSQVFMCSLKIRDFNCLTEKTAVKAVVKYEFSDANSTWVDITFVNLRG